MGYLGGTGGRNFAKPYTTEELQEIAASVKTHWTLFGEEIFIIPDGEFYGKVKVGNAVIKDVHPAAYQSIQKRLDMVKEKENEFVSVLHLTDSLIANNFRKVENYILNGVIDREGDSELTEEKAISIIQIWLLRNKK